MSQPITSYPTLSDQYNGYFITDATGGFVLQYNPSIKRIVKAFTQNYSNISSKDYKDFLNKTLFPYVYSTDNYGYLMSPDRTGVLTLVGRDDQGLIVEVYPLDASIDDQKITLNSNGTIYSQKYKTCLGTSGIEGKILDTVPDCLPHAWRITKTAPKLGNYPSLWDHIGDYPINVELAEDVYWNEKIGDPGGCGDRPACAPAC